MREQPLSGGNASGRVVRVGATVRKPWTRSSTAVQGLVTALRAHGVDAPQPLGRDQEGRQVLEYVEGTLALELPLDLGELARVGAMIRAIHDTSAELGLDGEWDVVLPVEHADLICHNDLAPWNLIVGERWVFIDWDGAGPSTRLWDLAYSAQSFAHLQDGRPVDAAAARLRALIDGYGADPQLRRALPAAMIRRTRAMYELLETAHRSGRQPWGAMFAEGHGDHWRMAAAYVERHERRWRDALCA